MSPTKEEVVGAVERLTQYVRTQDRFESCSDHSRAIETLLQAYASETAAREKALEGLRPFAEAGTFWSGKQCDIDPSWPLDDHELITVADVRSASDIYGRLKGEPSPSDTGVK